MRRGNPGFLRGRGHPLIPLCQRNRQEIRQEAAGTGGSARHRERGAGYPKAPLTMADTAEAVRRDAARWQGAIIPKVWWRVSPGWRAARRAGLFPSEQQPGKRAPLTSSSVSVNGPSGILPPSSCSKCFHELRNSVLPDDFLPD